MAKEDEEAIDDDQQGSTDREREERDEPVRLKGPQTEEELRHERLADILEVLPKMKSFKGYILHMWNKNPAVRSDPYSFYRMLSSIQGVDDSAAQQLTDATFRPPGGATGAPPGYIPPYGGAPAQYGQAPYSPYQQPYSPYPQPYGQQYPPQGYGPQPYYPPPQQPQQNVEEIIRKEREKWESEKEREDTRGALDEVLTKLKKIEEGGVKGKGEGMILIRKQLLDATGKPVLNVDGTAAIQEIEVPAMQAALYGIGPNSQQVQPQNQNADAMKIMLEVLDRLKGQQASADPAIRDMKDKMDKLAVDLNNAQRSSDMNSLKAEFGSKLDALTKSLELEKQKADTLKDLASKFGGQDKRMDDAAVVALKELETNTLMTTTALNNLNKTFTTAINAFARGNQTIPENVAGASEEEKKKLQAQYGDQVR